MLGAHLFAGRESLAGDRHSRRDWLQISSALGLSFLLPPLEGRAVEQRGPERPKSLITVWLEGGPSQLETWDPHPGTKIGGLVKAIPTKNPNRNGSRQPQVSSASGDIREARIAPVAEPARVPSMPPQHATAETMPRRPGGACSTR